MIHLPQHLPTLLWLLAALAGMILAPLLWGAIANRMARDLDAPDSVPDWWRDSCAAAQRDTDPWPASLRPASRLMLVAIVLALAVAASAIWPWGLAS